MLARTFDLFQTRLMIRHYGGLWVCVFSVSACTADLSVGSDVRITCASHAECPAGYSCSDNLGVCVNSSGDTVAPEVLNLTGLPAVVGPHRSAVLRFEASEPLAQNPVVELRWFGVEEVVPLQPSAVDHLIYEYTIAPPLDDGAQATYPEGIADLSVSMIDSAGLPGGISASGAVRVDYTAPDVFDSTVSVAYGNEAAPVSVVTAANPTTVTLVSFTVDEELLVPPEVFVGDGDLVFEEIDRLGNTYVFEALGAGSLASGNHPLEARLTDLAANEATVTIATFTARVQQPASADVAALDKVVYHRSPWGREATGPSPLFFIEGGEGAALPNATVIVRAGDAATSLELGRGKVSSGGSFAFALIPADFPTVHLWVVDDAGNVSDGVAVRNIEWTATFVGKNAGNAVSNPHVIYRVRPRNALTAQDDLPPLTSAEYARLAGIENTQEGSVSAQARGGWVLREPPSTELGLLLTAAAYDLNRARLLLFGGFNGDFVNTTWLWDGVSWKKHRAGLFDPSARAGHSVAFDVERDVIALFGGGTFQQSHNDLWYFDGQQWLLQEPMDGIRPPPRLLANLVYHPERQSLILWGGCDELFCSGGYNDTWEWNGEQWTDLGHAFPAVNPMLGAGVWDPVAGEIIHVAGCAEGDIDTCDEPITDLLRWTTNGWQVRSTNNTLPARIHPQVVFDPLRERVVAFGGRGLEHSCGTEQSAPCDDFYELTPLGWQAVAVTNTGDVLPSGGQGAVAFFDRIQNGVVTTLGGLLGDLSLRMWILRDLTFQAVVGVDPTSGEPIAPPGRKDASMAFDYQTRKLALYGGSPAGAWCEDPSYISCLLLWSWNGVQWDLADPGELSPYPEAREDHSMASDPSGRIVIYGGFRSGSGRLDDTWQWHEGAWSEMCTGCVSGSTKPQARTNAGFVFDEAREHFLLFGGNTAEGLSDELWAYQASADEWMLLCGGSTDCTGPSARDRFGIAYDEVREVVVVLGGNDAGAACRDANAAPGGGCNDTWEWDGSSWTKVCGVGTSCLGPAHGMEAALAYDSVRKRVLGYSHGAVIEMIDGQWMDISPPVSGPRVTRGVAAAFDPDRRRLAVFGGAVAETNPQNALWELDLGNDVNAGLTPVFALPQEFERTAVNHITLTAVSGATGYTLDDTLGDDGDLIGEPDDGVSWAVWSKSSLGWVSLGEHSASAESPQGATFASTHSEEARDWVLGSPLRLYLRAMPQRGEGNGPAPAQVVLDYIELQVRFRIQ